MTTSAKKARKSYKEPTEDEFDDAEEEDAPADAKQENGDDEEEEEDEDLDEDEYVVEKIFSHYIAEDVRLQLLTSPLLNFLGIFGGIRADSCV